MDEFLRDTYTLIFKEWILLQKYPYCDIYQHKYRTNTIIIKTKYSYSEIIFNNINIIELQVINSYTQETKFYLHFQMKTLKHAIHLYHEMLDCIENLIQHPQIKILLTCSSGLTTSYFAYKLNEAAKLLNINYSLDAIDYNNLYNVAYKYDIILLAPQISYTYNKTKEILKNKLVLNIPPKIFAQYDIKKTFIFIQDALNQTKKICRYFPQQIKTISKIHIDQTTLILSLFEQDYKIYILYRLYNNDKQIILDNKIIKPTYNIQDIFDIIDTCILKYPNIEQIGISMSNFDHYKKLNSSCLQDVNHKNLIKILKSRYPLKIFVNNDVNAAALGYYTTHNQYSSLAFLIQPIDSYARTGLIINKKLIHGYNHFIGQLQYLPLQLSDKPQILSQSPKSIIELVTKLIVSIISIINPELIVLNCKFITHTDELIDEVSLYIPKEYIPQIVLIDNIQEYIMLGEVILINQ